MKPRTGKPDPAEARARAQALALAPLMFHAVCSLRELGIVDLLWARRREGASREDVAKSTGVSLYAATVLLEAGLACEVLQLDGDRFKLSAVGYYLKSDEMTRVNLEFARDVCYAPLAQLTPSLLQGKPLGLEALTGEYSDGQTVYSQFASLPDPVKRSWLAFDHYYSQTAFPAAVPLVFARPVGRLLDVGGNTGRFARLCLEHDADVEVVIVDHPVQTNAARMAVMGFGARFRCIDRDLSAPSAFPHGFDVVWMSQVLDCFPEEQIVELLVRGREALASGGRLFVMEPCWDLQKHPAGASALTLTSLYFSCVANGNSRMYDSQTMRNLIDRASLKLVERHDGLGIGQSLFECQV